MKKLLCSALSLLLLPIFIFAQSPASKINNNYNWKTEASDSDMVFHFFSADKKSRQFYLLIEELYVPISPHVGFDLGRSYILPKNTRLNFYTMQIVENKEVFTQALSVDRNDISDFILGVYSVEEKLHYKVMDISLSAVGLGNIAVINLQPFALGINYKKKNYKIDFFSKFAGTPDSVSDYNYSNIPIYSLRNPQKPFLISGGEIEYKKTQRMFVLVFGVKTRDYENPNDAEQQIFYYQNKGLR